MINVFKCIKQSSHIQENSTTNEFLDIIKNGNEFLHYIYKARKALNNGNRNEYERIKKNKLPVYAHNFTFEKIRSNKNIIKSTGYIFLDVDIEINIDDLKSPYVFARWKSLSNLGLGILIKVSGITKENFSYNYQLLGKEIEIEVDKNAKKATQINVLSFDDELYINENSKVWKAHEEPLEIPHYSKKTKKTERVKNVLGHSGPKRYDNLQEFVSTLDFNGKKIYDWGEKTKLSKVYHSFYILSGKRYAIVNAQAYQYRCLNPTIGNKEIEDFVISMNKLCRPPLSEGEVQRIIHNIQNIPFEELEPIENYPRRFFFNENIEISTKEKRQLMMRIINQKRVEKSKQIIKETIENWDFEVCGTITQKKLADYSERSYNTVQKYYSEFKDRILVLNNSFKTLEKYRDNKKNK